MYKIIILLLFVSVKIQAERIGFIENKRGNVLVNQINIEANDVLNEGDVVTTSARSYAKILMNDDTQFTLGPNSSFKLQKIKKNNGKRDQLFNLLKGKFRVNVTQKLKEGEKLKVKVNQVVLGIRGTEILINAYQASNMSTSDILLLKGDLNIASPGNSPFNLKAGEYFNSQDLFKNGVTKAIKQLDSELLGQLKTASEEFLPNLLDLNSQLISLPSVLKRQMINAGVNAGIVGDLTTAKTPTIALRIIKKKKEKENIKKKLLNKKGIFTYDLSKEEWDIRDAVINYKKRHKENECFYFFFKALPGSGEAQRFRRKRDCDDFEYDL